MLAPTLFFYLIFFIYPVIDGLLLGLYDWTIISPTKTFVGLENLIYLAFDPGFHRALFNTVTITAVNCVTQLVFGFSLAWLARKYRRLGRIFLSVALVPIILSFVSVGIVWAWVYNPRFGILNGVLEAIGLESLTRAWTADPSTALLSIIITSNWHGAGLYAVIYSAALQTIPQSIYDAMKIDALSELKQIIRVVLPLLKDAIALSLVLTVSASFKIFGLVLVLTSGGPGRLTDVLVLHLYNLAFSRWQGGLACAVGIYLFVFSLLLVTLQMVVLRAKR